MRTQSLLAGLEQRFEDKLVLNRRAAEILERLGRTDDWSYGEAVNLAGEAYQGMGHLEAALDAYRRSVAIRRRIFGPEARDLGGALLDQARIERLLGRKTEALADASQGMAIRAASTRYDAIGRAELASAYRAAGQLEQALRVDRQSIEDAQAQDGSEGWRASFGLVGEGRDLLDLGRPAEAIAPLERARALRAHDQPPDQEVPFPLARALWGGGGDRARAHALAEEAGRALHPHATRYGSFYAQELQEIDRWLKEHPTR
jgi:tetratricopeptide (TPR) repeat protein